MGVGMDFDRSAGQISDLIGPGAGGVDDDAGMVKRAIGLHALNYAFLDEQSGDFFIEVE